MKITNHAKDNKKRLGIPTRALNRLAEKAMNSGLSPGECIGKLKNYVENKSSDGVFYRVYGEFLYVFGAGINPRLVTFYKLPRALRQLVKLSKEKRGK